MPAGEPHRAGITTLQHVPATAGPLHRDHQSSHRPRSLGNLGAPRLEPLRWGKMFLQRLGRCIETIRVPTALEVLETSARRGWNLFVGEKCSCHGLAVASKSAEFPPHSKSQKPRRSRGWNPFAGEKCSCRGLAVASRPPEFPPHSKSWKPRRAEVGTFSSGKNVPATAWPLHRNLRSSYKPSVPGSPLPR
ncbi:MAG: hypothetical protein DKINENOH_00778 [bacterium]|nr:hypothetical protein [bacterium]